MPARSLVVFALVASAASGCGGAFRYSTSGIRPRVFAGPRPALAEPIEAFVDGSRPPDGALAEVREAVVEHAARAEVVDRVLPAPTDASSLDAILSDAAAAGQTTVAFLRWTGTLAGGHDRARMVTAPFLMLGILPLLIINSLPINSHGAAAMFELVVVDPVTREVLLSTSRVASFAENVSAWGLSPYGIHRELMRTAVELLFDDLGAAAAADYPERHHVEDLADVVLGRRLRRDAGVLHGPGFDLALPPAAVLTAATSELARFTVGDDASFAIRMQPIDFAPRDFVDVVRHDLTELVGVEGDFVRDVSGHEGHELRGFMDDGTRVAVLTVGVGGIGYRFECWLPPGTRDEVRDACLRTLQTVELSVAGRGR